MDQKLVEKAISMQRDYSMDEIAELLGVRREELVEAVAKHVSGERPTAPPEKPDVIEEKKKHRSGKRKRNSS